LGFIIGFGRRHRSFSSAIRRRGGVVDATVSAVLALSRLLGEFDDW